MTENLDQYRPTMTELAGVRRQLLNTGIESHAIPDDWLFTILAATKKWLSTSPDGARMGAELLGLEIFRGDDDKEYKLIHGFAGGYVTIKPDDIQFFRGVIAKGKPVPFSQLKISERVGRTCDSCGIISHCTKVIRDPSSAAEHIQTLCNHCIACSESFALKEVVSRNEEDGRVTTDDRIIMKDYGTCERCTVYSCYHHPKRLHAVNE